MRYGDFGSSASAETLYDAKEWWLTPVLLLMVLVGALLVRVVRARGRVGTLICTIF